MSEPDFIPLADDPSTGEEDSSLQPPRKKGRYFNQTAKKVRLLKPKKKRSKT